MGRKEQRFFRERKNFVGDRIILFACITTGKVAAACAVDEDRVSRQDPIVRVQTDAIRGMAGRMKDAQAHVTDGDHLAIFNVDVNMWGRGATVHDERRVGQIVQFPSGGAMVRMRMRVDNGIKLTAVVGKQSKIALDFLSHGVNQRRFVGALTSNEVGFAFTAIEFTK
jgi:hypothetical protein